MQVRKQDPDRLRLVKIDRSGGTVVHGMVGRRCWLSRQPLANNLIKLTSNGLGTCLFKKMCAEFVMMIGPTKTIKHQTINKGYSDEA